MARMTATPRGWRDLGREFEKLSELEERKYFTVVWHPRTRNGLLGVSVPGGDGEWEVAPWLPDAFKDQRRRSFDATKKFSRVARAAAVAGGCEDRRDSWVYWLEGIRRNDLGRFNEHRSTWEMPTPTGDPKKIRSRRVVYEGICETSAQYCRLIAAGAASPPGGAGPAKNQNGPTLPPSISQRKACSWADVEIVVHLENRVQLSVKGKSLGFKTFDEMGFADKRTREQGNKGRVPSAVWLLFQKIAVGSGEVNLSPRKPSPSSSKKRSSSDSYDKDKYDAHHAGDGRSQEPSSSGQTSTVYSLSGGEPSVERKQVRKIEATLRATLKGLGHDIPDGSRAFTCVGGKYSTVFGLRLYKVSSAGTVLR